MQNQTKTVVIVEDSNAVRERLRTALSETPGVALVAEYENADQAIAGMALVAPDAVILDIRLGQSYSMELLRFLKRRHPQTLVVMYSNYSDTAHRAAYTKAGADYFFDKTGETDELLALLARLGTH